MSPHPQGVEVWPEPAQPWQVVTCWKVPSGVRAALTTWPVPPHIPQVVARVPDFTPLPVQGVHSSRRTTSSSFSQPVAARWASRQGAAALVHVPGCPRRGRTKDGVQEAYLQVVPFVIALTRRIAVRPAHPAHGLAAEKRFEQVERAAEIPSACGCGEHKWREVIALEMLRVRGQRCLPAPPMPPAPFRPASP